MTLVDSPQSGNKIHILILIFFCLDIAKDVSLSFDEVYMHMVTGEVRGVSCSGPSMTFEQSYSKFEEFEFPIIFY